MKHENPVTARAVFDRTASGVSAELGVDITALSRWQLAALALEAVELVRLSIEAEQPSRSGPSITSSPRVDAEHAAHYLRWLREWYS